MARFDPSYQNSDGSWNSHHWFDTMVTTYFPPNVGTAARHAVHELDLAEWHTRRTPRACTPAASTIGFCDGSVRFIKNSISSWAFSTTGTAYFSTASLPDRGY